MTPEEFVHHVRVDCIDGAVKDCVNSFNAPPGRKPRAEVLRLSAWFNALSNAEKTLVAEAMREAADAAVFGVFCVIDGVRTIESTPEQSEFRLTANLSGQESVLAPSDTFLHDLLRSES